MKKNKIITVLAAISSFIVFTEACSSAEMTEDISGTWILSAVDGNPIAMSDRVPNFTIAGNTISGFDGCNQFGGQLDDPQSLRIGQLGCVGEYLKIPLDLGNPKAHLGNAKLEGGKLYLPAYSGLPSSVFVRR